jgi:hypothetical protein
MIISGLLELYSQLPVTSPPKSPNFSPLSKIPVNNYAPSFFILLPDGGLKGVFIFTLHFRLLGLTLVTPTICCNAMIYFF